MGIATDAESLLLDAAEAARLLGICRAGVYRAVSSGRMPGPVRIGRRTLWRRDELEDWVNAGCPARTRWEWPEGAGG